MYRETKYISVKPDVQFGVPCVKGTRIPCYTLKFMHKGGDSVKMLASIYNIKPVQVRAALKNKLRAISCKKMSEWYFKRGLANKI